MANSFEGGRKLAVTAGGILALVGIAWAVWVRLPPPQLKADERVFNTVDALFTAITAHDRRRLEECDRRLKSYHAEGQTSDAVAATLDAIVKQAQDGKWDPAARKLYDFMLGQRGEAGAG
jgi:hypothetical protein